MFYYSCPGGGVISPANHTCIGSLYKGRTHAVCVLYTLCMSPTCHLGVLSTQPASYQHHVHPLHATHILYTPCTSSMLLMHPPCLSPWLYAFPACALYATWAPST